jgi:hypothetical protein
MNRPGITPQGAGYAAYRAIIVHGYAQAQDALRPGIPVALLSAVGAASLGGAAWWRGLVDAARESHPETTCIDILDCADTPGFAMAALRLGQKHLILWNQCPAFQAVQSAAATVGAIVHSTRPAALDLGERGAYRRLEQYLHPLIGPGPLDRDSTTPLR